MITKKVDYYSVYDTTRPGTILIIIRLFTYFREAHTGVPYISKFYQSRGPLKLSNPRIPSKQSETLHLAGISSQSRGLSRRKIPAKQPETLHLAGISRQNRGLPRRKIPAKQPETLHLAGISRQNRGQVQFCV